MRPEKIKAKLTIDGKDDFVVYNIEEPKFLRRVANPYSTKYIWGITLGCIGTDDLCWIRDNAPNIRGKQFKLSVSVDGKEMSSLSNTILDMTARWEILSPTDVFTYDVKIEFVSEEPPLIADDLYLDSVPDSAWTNKIQTGVMCGNKWDNKVQE